MSQEAESSRKVKLEEEDVPELVDESEEEREEEEAAKKRRVQELLEKWEALQIHRKVLGIVHMLRRSKTTDEECRLRASIGEAERAVKNIGKIKYQGSNIRSLHVPERVARVDRTLENGWEPKDIKNMNDESDEEYGIYINE